MTEVDARRWPRAPGLRVRLALALAAIVALTLVGVFFAVYADTGTQVRAQIDQDLRQDVRGLVRGVLPFPAVNARSVSESARDYIERQPPFGASARLYVVQVTAGTTVTNEPELLGLAGDLVGEHETSATSVTELAQSHALLRSKPGLHTFSLVDAGLVRTLTQRLVVGGRQIATLQVAEPLGAARRAQEGVRRAFALAGGLALLAALLAGYLVTDRISRRLRRMARIAARVDTGELDHRIHATGPRDEVLILADAFDHMLDRLQDAFDRQQAFVADASHELRTPLTVIGGQLEVLARQQEVSREDVVRVERAVRIEVARMQRLVDDLLLLARADRSGLIRKHPVELEPFLATLFEGLRLTSERELDLAAVPDGILDADSDRLAQVIQNLIKNAIEHTGPGGHVRLSATVEGDAALLRIAVDDDGVGIPPEQRERIFDRFHRIDLARTRAGGGAGLGLAIARTIVEAHDGRIWAAESPSGGARVAFELPGWSPAATGQDT